MQQENSQEALVRLLQESGEMEVQQPAWYQAIKAAVNDLINNDFDALLQLLYRVDVSEAKLRGMLQQLPGSDAADIITKLLVERQVQKIKSRQQFQSPPSDNEEEAW